jgi:phenylpropionate dioxygenase-like ring-hydroxylating dioxygenase large terminal subunit
MPPTRPTAVAPAATRAPERTGEAAANGAVAARRRSDAITADFRPGSFALRDTWLPLAHLRQIGRRPVCRTMHGRPVYLWRDGGTLRATEDSRADIEGDRRRASEFTGGTGDYPLAERYGYAWVWYGDPAAASPELVPRVPHVPADGVPRHMQAEVVFDCSYELICENLLDLTHADFLHSWLTGDPLSDNDEITVSSTSETVTMTRTAIGRRTPKAQRHITKSETQDLVAVTLVHVRSGVCLLHGDFRPGMSVRMLHPVNQELPDRCRTPVSFNVQQSSRMVRHAFPFSAHIVGSQDNWAVRPQNALYRGTEHCKDSSSRFDAAGLRFRKIHGQLVERQRQGDHSYLCDGDPGRDVSAELQLS